MYRQEKTILYFCKKVVQVLQWNIGYVPNLHLLEFYIKCNHSDLQNCLLRELHQGELDTNLHVCVLLLFLSYFHWTRQTGLWWHFLRSVSVKPLRMSLHYSFPTLKETLVFYEPVKNIHIYENCFLHRHPVGWWHFTTIITRRALARHRPPLWLLALIFLRSKVNVPSKIRNNNQN